MTTTDLPPTGPTETRPRLLRRSRTERFGAGVCGGLGEYFGVDPILFRVLVAVAALFGGSGILAYLIAWAVIPEAGTEHAPVDSFIDKLRHHRVPVWAVAIGIGLVLWLAAFSWWSPGPFVPVVAIVVVLVVVLNRRDWQGTRSAGAPAAPTVPPAATAQYDSTVSLTKDASVPVPGQTAPLPAPATMASMRAWVDEAKRAARERRRRALPVRIAALGGMAVVLVLLAALDAIKGVPMVAYFWTVLGFAVLGLLAGLALRRTPWSIATLIPIALAGVLALGGSHAAFHDGVGDRSWQPTALAASYRLGAGQATLDLRKLSDPSGARISVVTVGAGQVTVIVPGDLEVSIESNVHIGQVTVRDANGIDHVSNGGTGVSQTTGPSAEATGYQYGIDIHLGDGRVLIDRR